MPAPTTSTDVDPAPAFTVGTVVAAVAAAVPDRDAVVQGARRLTYAALADRTRRLAQVFVGAGLGADGADPSTAPGHELGQDIAHLLMTNGPEYLEGMVGAYAARVAPGNVNYRYTATELADLLADGARPGPDGRPRRSAVVHHARFAPVLADALALVGADADPLLLRVDDGSGTPPLPGALDYEAALAGAPDGPVAPRGGPVVDGDAYLVYTGGTTGRPKAVLWRQADFLAGALGLHPPVAALARAAAGADPSRLRAVATPPLMHGAAHWNALSCWAAGGTVVLAAPGDRLDPADVLDTAARERCTSLLVVGDALARPLLDEQRARPRDLSALRHLVTGGAVLSPTLKQAWVDAVPGLRIIDIVGSSESGRMGVAGGTATGRFGVDARTRVLSADRTRALAPGDPEVGWLARTGPLPRGYLGDEAATAATFPVVDGVRHVVAGDRARALPDGEVELLGRDAATINTGGEKVYAEEVEQALKAHPAVADAVVAGRPSERWGHEVVAVVALRPGVDDPGDDALVATAAEVLARYKLPKAVVRVEEVVRTPSGKADYAWARAVVGAAGALA